MPPILPFQPNPVSQPLPAFSRIKSTAFWEKRWFKVFYFLSFLISFFGGTVFLVKELAGWRRQKQSTDLLLETNYEQVNWEGFGRVFEPIVKVPIYYPQEGYKPESFLIDSGALVSSLPRETAAKMGFSLAMLPRSTFSGYGNTTSFAYRADLKAKLGKEEIELPVVFTQAAGTKPILGRSGFFEKFTISFDAREKKIKISR